METIEVFVSDEVSPSSVQINFHIPHSTSVATLHSFHVQWQNIRSKISVSEAYTIACKSAVPAFATRQSIHDTVVVTPEGSLELLTSSGRSIPLNTPRQPDDGRDEVAQKMASSLSMVIDDDEMMSSRVAERRIDRVLDPVGPRCTVVFEGEDRVRVSADFRPRQDLSRQCIEALSCVLPAEAFFIVKREVLAEMNSTSVLQRRTKDNEWDIFEKAVEDLLGITRSTTRQSPFRSLLANAEKSLDPITHRLAARARLRRPPEQDAAPAVQPELRFGETIHISMAQSILYALHLVAQDTRLSLTRQSNLSKLAPLIARIAGRIGRVDWQDYWIRLVPDAIIPSGAPQQGELVVTGRLIVPA